MKRTGSLGIQILISTRDNVLGELASLGAYLYYSAVTGSQYIKFKDPRVGSLRIGDHRGKEKYRYKWNLLAGGTRRTTHTDRTERFFYPLDQLKEMCGDIRAHRRHLLEKYGEYDVTKDRFAGKRNRIREIR